MSTTLNLLSKFIPQVRQMHRDTIRIKSEREEWRQRFTSLKARLEANEPERALSYDDDGLATIHHAAFLKDERFRRAYRAGVEAAGHDPHREWRLQTVLWVAEQARHLAGDFGAIGEGADFLAGALREALPGKALLRNPGVPAGELALLIIEASPAEEERAAERFWPALVAGGWLVLDGYSYAGREAQQTSWDRFSQRCGVGILNLPTGQGLVIKRGAP